jgi:hypothetical protein
MSGIETGNFDKPNETRTPPKTKADVVKLGSLSASRFTLEPGWKWSDCIKPVAGTDSCQAHHFGVVQSGRLHVKHSDGTEGEVGPGDAYVVEPGHDAWVVGDEAFVGYEFDAKTADTYAKK